MRVKAIRKVQKINIRKPTDNQSTKFGGSASLIQYIDIALNFRLRFSAVTIKKGKNSVFSSTDMLLGMLALIMLGCDRVYHINNRFKDDELLAKQSGLVRIFDQSTASRFLAKFTKHHINQLERILYWLIIAEGRFKRSGENALDIDASDLTRSSHNTEGAKPGRNKKNKGKDSYSISCGFSQNQVVATDMTSGNTHCSQALTKVYKKALAVMKRIDLIRLDAGYISINTLKWLLVQTISESSTETVKFLVGCNSQAKGVEEAKKYARKHPEKWIQIEKGNKKIWVMDFRNTQLFKDYPEGLVRLVLVKMVQRVKTCKKNKVRYKSKTKIYAIATNLTRGYGARQIFKKYQQRQRIELMFRELKNPFNVGKLPSKNMNANYAYFLLCCLAYNASYYFKRDVLPKKYQNHSMNTIRQMFIEVPAKRFSAWDIQFNLNYKYAKGYDDLTNKLTRLISNITDVVLIT